MLGNCYNFQKLNVVGEGGKGAGSPEKLQTNWLPRAGIGLCGGGEVGRVSMVFTLVRGFKRKFPWKTLQNITFPLLKGWLLNP